MSEINESSWPFTELPKDAGLDFDAIFGGTSTVQSDVNPFEAQQSAEPPESAAASVPQPTETRPAPAESKPNAPAAENPLQAAFAEKTAENAQKGLFEKPPVFCHKGAKEPIEDTSMTFEDLRIRKSEDFVDLEEGKYVSWSVDYGSVHKDIKDPKGTTIASVKEMIERSRDFLEALKKSKDKNPDCLIKPKVVTKNKGTAPYKGFFRNLEEARDSDKVICLIPSDDGRIYDLRKTEQGEFIAPKNKVTEFQTIRAGFTPALPLIPMQLIGKIAAFFRSFMVAHVEYEALALIYWDKVDKRFFAYVPKQTVRKEHVEADLRDCPYDDEGRYIRYADIHSHNSMEAFFSGEDDRDELGTGIYIVLGRLDRFFPDIKARISCGGSFVNIDPSLVVESLDKEFPKAWSTNVTCEPRKKMLKCSHFDTPDGFIEGIRS